MSVATTLLVVLSALVHASWNAVLRRDPAPRDAVGPISVVAALVAFAWAALRGRLGEHTALGWGVVAGAFEAGYFFALGRALASGRLGPVYTIARGGAVVLVWPISALVFDERLSAIAGGGAVVVLVGLALSAGRDPPSSTSGAPPRVANGTGWAIVTALFIAGYHLAYTRALRVGGDASVLAGVSLGLAGIVHYARVRVARGAFPAPTAGRLGAGLLAGAGFVMFLSALSRGGAGAVLTLRNVSVLFALGLGRFGGERPRAVQWLGAALVAAGAAAVSLG